MSAELFLLFLVMVLMSGARAFLHACSFGATITSKDSHRFSKPSLMKRVDSLRLSRWSAPESVSRNDSNVGAATFSVELPKASGITWGSDLSFRWVYVLDVNPQSEAAQCGKILKGDYIIGFGNTSLIAEDFDFVLTTLAKQPARFNYTFFRGSKDLLTGEAVLSPRDRTVTVKVLEKGKPDRILSCPGGTNLRNLLVSNGVNVYRSITRWTNCNGKQRCGTCIVDVKEGMESCSRRALDEESTLRENPENYRLSCVTSVYGDVVVEVQGPVGAAQWTR